MVPRAEPSVVTPGLPWPVPGQILGISAESSALPKGETQRVSVGVRAPSHHPGTPHFQHPPFEAWGMSPACPQHGSPRPGVGEGPGTRMQVPWLMPRSCLASSRMLEASGAARWGSPNTSRGSLGVCEGLSWVRFAMACTSWT